MRILYSCITFFLCTFMLSAWGDQLIIEPDMGRAPIIDAIKEARHSLNLVMYGFTDESLLEALLKQKSAGKTVKIILEQTPYKAEDENKNTLATLDGHQIAWHGSVPPLRLIHQKTLIIDNRKALIMTFNFTHSSFKNERNFAILIDDPQKVQAIATTFSADWNHVPTNNQLADLIFSPDDSRQKLLNLIAQAKNSIQIYAQSVSDYKIVGALAKAAKTGVKVTIITSGKIREKQADYLARAGVQVHQSKRLYIHAKALIFDHQKAVLGSINLTRGSLDHNRELALITRDPQVVKQLENTFNQDLHQTNSSLVNKSTQHFTIDQHMVLQTVKMLKKLSHHLTPKNSH